MPPKVAVIMAACNAQDYIAGAIDSILAQTCADFEFIIVENGSTDKTWEIISSYEDRRIKAFRTPIKQLSYNLNFGISQTDCRYIARMDCDDIALPDRLTQQMNFLDANPDVGVVGSAFKIFGNSFTDSRIVKMPLTDKEIRRKLPFRFCFCHPSVMFRRKMVIDIGGYQGGRFCQDVDLWFRLSRDKNIKFANLSDVLIEYRVHPSQARGNRECFIINSAQIFRESLTRKSPLFFAGFIVSLFKILRGQKK
ncbi:MAG: glycosyltransferase [Anaerohalosphaeraceae bacterium]|nr:glycosyltransferase [Anaerohalosphaeraceae bacterium]